MRHQHPQRAADQLATRAGQGIESTPAAFPVDPTEHPPSLNDQALEAIGQARAAAMHSNELLARMHELLEAQQTPAQFDTVTIDASHNPRVHRPRGDAWKSIGVLNPTSQVVYLGIGGVSGTAAARAVPVAPKSLLVLPVDGWGQIEIGTDATALGASTAVVYVMLFASVQPPLMAVMPT